MKPVRFLASKVITMPMDKDRKKMKDSAPAAELEIAAPGVAEEAHEAEPHGEAAPGEGHHDEGYLSGPDDALGLYLKQMGAIPLLSRNEELVLAEKLERARDRYRRAVLFSWNNLREVYNLYRQVQAGQLPIDPVIDVVTSLAGRRTTSSAAFRGTFATSRNSSTARPIPSACSSGPLLPRARRGFVRI